MISLKNASVGYVKNAPVLEGLDLEFAPGKVHGVIGLNGMGKSCLLKTLSGELPLLGGESHELGTKSVPLARHGVAYVPPVMQVSDMTTVAMMLKVGRTPYLPPWGSLGVEDRKVIDDVTQRMGLQDWLCHHFNELSSGQQQRVLLAMGLVRGADVLCLDEPTSHLDVLARKEMFDRISRLARDEGKTMIVCTHSIEFALRYLDDLLLVHDHRYIKAGKEDVLSSELAREAFGEELLIHWRQIVS